MLHDKSMDESFITDRHLKKRQSMKEIVLESACSSNKVSYYKVESRWRSIIGVSKSQFFKTTVTITNKIGTYRNNNQFGALTLYYYDKKLRDKLMELSPT